MNKFDGLIHKPDGSIEHPSNDAHPNVED